MTLADIRTVYPDYEEPFYGPCDYDPMVASLGHDVVLSVADDDYQGDTRYLLRARDGRYGVLVISWGSCSGCDALQACESFADLEKLREFIAKDIIWRADADAVIALLADENGPVRAGWHDKEHARFVASVGEKLREVQA